jgi:GT2 family glycosyltransferase
MSIDLTVIIVSWNCRDRLDACLRSVFEAADEISREVIVVDNGSQDGTPEYLRAGWPAVRVIPLPRNHGFGVANNVGFAAATGDYILVLNPDTRILPGMLSTMIETLRADETIGCVGAKHYNPDLSLQWSMDDFPSLLNESLHYSDLYRLPFLRGWLRRKYPRWSDHNSPRDVAWVNGACMMVPRAVYEATGGFDDYFFLFAEELDWCLRIWRAGWRVRFLPTAGLIHDLGGTFDPHDWRRLVLLYQSSLRYYRRHRPLPELAGLHLMIRLNALVRLIILLTTGAAEGIARRPVLPEPFRRAVVQHENPLPLPIALRMWWAILTLRTDTELRPVTPSRVGESQPVTGFESPLPPESSVAADDRQHG